MYSFKKLKQNSDFRRIYGRGETFVCPAFVAYALKNRTNEIRLGITVSKKLGGAVSRNRAKRVLTAAFAQCVEKIPAGYDFVLVARTRIFSTTSTRVSEQLSARLASAGIVKP